MAAKVWKTRHANKADTVFFKNFVIVFQTINYL